MKRSLLVALAACALAAPAFAADPDHPVVVELFQSQGCSSCPPANARVLAIAGRPDVLALSWEVTYWDHLGWRDTFGNAAFTQRQYDYARALGHDGVFTPQVVVNGRVDGVGSQDGELAGLITQGDRGNAGPAVHVTDSSAQIGAGSGQADVMLVRYDPALVRVPIRRGENAGETLPHRNVVHQVIKLGTWRGQAETFALPTAPAGGLKSAILLQAAGTGPILAAGHS